MGPLQAFNFRMSESGEGYRLVEMAHRHAPVGAAAAAYELRRLESSGSFSVCHRIHDLPPVVATAIAEAFLSGVHWGRRGMPDGPPAL